MTGTSVISANLLPGMTPAVRGYVEALLARNAVLEVMVRQQQDVIAVLRVEIEQLKSQVKRLTPTNSSVPPSTQHPHARPAPKAGSKNTTQKKKRGGQPGHPRHERALIPTWR